jgi:hypothetical protein
LSNQDKDQATLRRKVGAAWEDLERRVEAGVQKALSRALAPIVTQVGDLRARVEKLGAKLEEVARTRLSARNGEPQSRDKSPGPGPGHGKTTDH